MLAIKAVSSPFQVLELENAAFRLKGLAHEFLVLGRFSWYRRLLLTFQIHRVLFLDYRRSALSVASSDRTYGDTPVLTAYRIGQLLKLDDKTLWVEPGAGIGLSALAIHLAFGCRVLAIEIEPHRHRAAQLLSKSLRSDETRLRWIQGDFLQIDWPQECCVYLTGLTWSSELWQSVLKKLEAECPRATVLSVGRELPDDRWQLIQMEEMPYSWGMSELHIYRRRA
jgi:hypothetical protein